MAAVELLEPSSQRPPLFVMINIGLQIFQFNIAITKAEEFSSPCLFSHIESMMDHPDLQIREPQMATSANVERA
jgi:hypothetical protein